MLGRLKERFSPGKTVKRQEKRQRRAMQFEMLERRILPSAGGVIASHMVKQMTDAAAPPCPRAMGLRADAACAGDEHAKVASISPRYHLNVAEAQQAWAAKQAASPVSNAAAASPAITQAHATSPGQAGAQFTASSQKPVREIVFVDPSVTDYTQLIQDIVRGNANRAGQGRAAITSTATGAIDDNGTLIVVLNPNKDGIDQITQVLSQYQGVSAVYILSHGAQGLVTLGTSALDAESLQSRSAEISGWQASLTPGADILLYACDVAGTPAGVQFRERPCGSHPHGCRSFHGESGWRRQGRLDPRLLNGRRDGRALVLGHVRGRIQLSPPRLLRLVPEPERDPDGHERERYLRLLQWLGKRRRHRHGHDRDKHPRLFRRHGQPHLHLPCERHRLRDGRRRRHPGQCRQYAKDHRGVGYEPLRLRQRRCLCGYHRRRDGHGLHEHPRLFRLHDGRHGQPRGGYGNGHPGRQQHHRHSRLVHGEHHPCLLERLERLHHRHDGHQDPRLFRRDVRPHLRH